MLREIGEDTSADPGLPDIELAGTIGEKRDELSVGRNFGALLGALPIRQQRECGVGEIDGRGSGARGSAIRPPAVMRPSASATAASGRQRDDAADRSPGNAACSPDNDSSAKARSRAD